MAVIHEIGTADLIFISPPAPENKTTEYSTIV
jgi:hypothetical protein